jgi:GAF domain-containing protein
MFQAQAIDTASKTEFYRALCSQLRGLLDGERDLIANAANTSALLFQTMPEINWAGFYFLRENNELVLGPFQGKPACVRIASGRGVCGAALVRARPCWWKTWKPSRDISPVIPLRAPNWWCR